MTDPLPEKRHAGIIIIGILSLVAVALLFFFTYILNPVELALEEAQQDISRQQRSGNSPTEQETIPFDNGRFSSVQYFPAAAGFSDAALHNNTIYIASSCGLFLFSPDGELLRTITYQNGLPHASVTDLAEFNGQLYAATPAGLARINTDSVTTITADGFDTNITSLLIYNSRLIMGTESGEIISLGGDGIFSREYSRVPGAPSVPITALTSWKGRLAAGTRDKGVFLLSDTSWTNIPAGNSLPSPVITDLIEQDGDLLIATMAGLVRMQAEGQATVVPGTGLIRCLADDGVDLLAGTHDGRVFRLQGNQRQFLSRDLAEDPVPVNAIVDLGNRIMVLGNERVSTLESDGLSSFGSGWEAFLSWPHISALAVDSLGSSWLGYFDRGVEVRTPDLAFSQRWLTDDIRYIKCMVFDAVTGSILVGTSRGLHFYRAGGQHDSLTAKDGLISNEVNHVQRVDEELLAVATGSGLSLVSANGIESLNAFHGLSSNKALCLAVLEPLEQKLIALGSLGGLDIIDSDLNITSFTPDSSALPAHWVSALSARETVLSVGTYGKGLTFYDPFGSELFPAEQYSQVVINPLAMLWHENLLLCGTLANGLLIYNQENNNWYQLLDRLPSANVTALAIQGNTLLCGTELGLAVIEVGSLTR